MKKITLLLFMFLAINPLLKGNKHSYKALNWAIALTAAGAGAAGLSSTVFFPDTTEQFLLWLDRESTLPSSAKTIVLKLLSPIMVPLRDSLSETEKAPLRSIIAQIGLDPSTISLYEEPTTTGRADSITCKTIALSRDLLEPGRELELSIKVGYAAATIKNRDHAFVSAALIAAPLAAKAIGKIVKDAVSLFEIKGYKEVSYYSRHPLLRTLCAWIIFAQWTQLYYLESEALSSQHLKTTQFEIEMLQRSLDTQKKQGLKAALAKIVSFLERLLSPFPNETQSLSYLRQLK